MNNKLFSLFLISSFCLIATPPAKELAQILVNPSTTEQQKKFAKVDPYLKCLAVFVVSNQGGHTDKNSTILTKEGEKFRCFGKEFESLFEIVTKNNAAKLDEYCEALAQKFDMSKSHFKERLDIIFLEILKKLDK